MIQRIQSVYLFLAAFLMSGLFLEWADLLRIDTTAPATLGEMAYFNDKQLDIYDQSILLAFTAIVTFFALVAIFLYRNRKLQIMLSRVSMLVVLLFLILAIYITYSDLAPFMSAIHFKPGPGIIFPFLVIVMLVLAVRGIRKDDKLVKSMDRLR